jgi:hypothetical protein
MARFGTYITSGFCSLTLLAIAGCGGGASVFPLREGDVSQFSIRSDFGRGIGEMRVTGRTAVGGVSGFEISSPFGNSAVAWMGDTLVASQLNNTFFDPPIPIAFQPGGNTKSEWAGIAITAGNIRQLKATTEQEGGRFELLGQRMSAQVSLVRLEDGNKVTELTTWMVPGRGIMRQEQRTNDKLDRVIERL